MSEQTDQSAVKASVTTLTSIMSATVALPVAADKASPEIGLAPPRK